MRDAIGDADTVVNLIGKHYETKHLCFTRKEDGSINRVNSSFKNVSHLAEACVLIYIYIYEVRVDCQLPSTKWCFSPVLCRLETNSTAQPIKQHPPGP